MTVKLERARLRARPLVLMTVKLERARLRARPLVLMTRDLSGRESFGEDDAREPVTEVHWISCPNA
jgi:hypothetical protein